MASLELVTLRSTHRNQTQMTRMVAAGRPEADEARLSPSCYDPSMSSRIAIVLLCGAAPVSSCTRGGFRLGPDRDQGGAARDLEGDLDAMTGDLEPSDLDGQSPPALGLTSVSPKAVVIGIETTLTLRGTGFDASLTVEVDGRGCGSLKVLDSERATCLLPASALPKEVAISARRNSDGSKVALGSPLHIYRPSTADQTFGNAGTALANVADDYPWDRVLALPDDKLLVSGERRVVGTPGTREPVLLQVAADGSLDPGFGKNGVASTKVPATTESWFCDHLLTDDGKILVSGNGFAPNGNIVTILTRFLANGQLDTSFAQNGFWVVQLGVTRDHSCQIEIEPNTGAIYIGGHMDTASDNELQLARLDRDGVPDTSFGTGGRARVDMGVQELSFDFALSGGRIIMAAVDGPGKRARLVAFDKKGKLDLSYGAAGFVTLPAGTSSVGVNRLQVQADGKLLAFGASTDTGGNADFAI
jgi:uncharacterized delta-60 repeat protein